MFGFFKKKKAHKRVNVQFVDMNGIPLTEGDVVMSHRYDLGKCVVKMGTEGYEYESLESGKTVSWTLMVDAVNERQKVEKTDL
jgi:hypothetical protein